MLVEIPDDSQTASEEEPSDEEEISSDTSSETLTSGSDTDSDATVPYNEPVVEENETVVNNEPGKRSRNKPAWLNDYE